MEYILIFIVVILYFLIDSLISKRKTTSEIIYYPYYLRDDFLSPAEHNFYLTLKHAVSDWALICPKVSLSDLFYVKTSDQSEFRTYTNKIDRKHVDFLLCNPKTVRPIMGIELDDKSHRAGNREERDEFVEMVFSTVDLPLARIPVKHSYSTTELNSLLRQQIDLYSDNSTNEIDIIEDENDPPLCPKCSSEMVLRKAKTGTNQGKHFWGCPNYPRCRGILNIENP
jgi:hypothetical protein